MPVLEKIVVQDYRNIELQELCFSPDINCISGDNGAGKTNLLDAIWYLSMTKSAFGSSDRYVVRHGCAQLAISGNYRMEDGSTCKVSVKAGEGEKKIKKDDKLYTRLSDHIGLIPIVMVSPSDTSLVSESGDDRRRFVNSVLSQMDKAYLDDVQHYTSLLLSRNQYLKSGKIDKEYLDVLDSRMDLYAGRIFESRQRFVSELEPAVKEYYSRLSGNSEEVGIEYRSDLQKGRFLDILRNTVERDTILGYTASGVQRDDFIFSLNGHPIRKCGSQGQQKSFLVSLKFAQYGIMKQNYGYPPILLLDDLFDKLDMKRVENLLKMVSGVGFGQIFLTDSNKVRIGGVLDGLSADKSFFETKGGVFSKIDG